MHAAKHLVKMKKNYPKMVDLVDTRTHFHSLFTDGFFSFLK